LGMPFPWSFGHVHSPSSSQPVLKFIMGRVRGQALFIFDLQWPVMPAIH
jgi:hypothetical protein